MDLREKGLLYDFYPLILRICMNLRAIHEICCSWREEVFSERFWTYIVWVLERFLISINIVSMCKESIFTWLNITPPWWTRILKKTFFRIKYTIYRSPASWKEVFKREITTWSDWNICLQYNFIKPSFLERQGRDRRSNNKFSSIIDSFRLFDEFKGSTDTDTSCCIRTHIHHVLWTVGYDRRDIEGHLRIITLECIWHADLLSTWENRICRILWSKRQISNELLWSKGNTKWWGDFWLCFWERNKCKKCLNLLLSGYIIWCQIKITYQWINKWNRFRGILSIDK